MNTQLPMGGTEILVRQLEQLIPDRYANQINLVVSNSDPALIDTTKKNVLWQHLNVDQQQAQNLKNPEYINQLDAVVFVSHWQYHQFRSHMGVPAVKSVVIPNATTVTNYIPRHNSIKRIAYTSTPWRGLNVLLAAFDLLNREDTHLDVFSSTEIYGSEFAAAHNHKYQELWDFCNNHPRITLHGYRSNSEIKDCLAHTDIFAYPSIWEETFCLSALEALAAGCKVVLTNLAALPEVAGPWADYVSYGSNHPVLVERFAHALNNAVYSCPFDGRAQSEHFNRHYSWPVIVPRWLNLFDKLAENNH